MGPTRLQHIFFLLWFSEGGQLMSTPIVNKLLYPVMVGSVYMCVCNDCDRGHQLLLYICIHNYTRMCIYIDGEGY